MRIWPIGLHTRGSAGPRSDKEQLVRMVTTLMVVAVASGGFVVWSSVLIPGTVEDYLLYTPGDIYRFRHPIDTQKITIPENLGR
jgi:hypothetical protein